MVLTTYKKKGIRLSHAWFVTPDELASLTQTHKGKTDLMYVHGAQSSPPKDTTIFEIRLSAFTH